MITPEEIMQLVRRSSPTILDVGCNDGEHTRMFLSLFDKAHVFCFEPDPRAVQRFGTQVVNARAKLFVTAVGAVDGHANFYQSGGWPSSEHATQYPKGWDLSGSIRKPAAHKTVHPWCTFDGQIEVPVVRLDTWAETYMPKGVIDFIWADVQGAEGDLVLGGQEVLKRTKYFYTEYDDHELYEGQSTLEKLRWLLPLEFELLRLYPHDVLFYNKRAQ